MMLYLKTSKIRVINFYVYQCEKFTHNNKASHKTDVNRICWFIQGTKDKVLVFNPPKQIVLYCYVNADFSGLWGHENAKYPICAKIRTGFVVTFYNYHLLWV